jgi:hypothetical protein
LEGECLLNISVTLMLDRVEVEAPNRRPSVVVVVLLVSLALLYTPLEGSRVSLLSRPTALRPDDKEEIPESSDREPWREYVDEEFLRTHTCRVQCCSTAAVPWITPHTLWAATIRN